MNNGKNLLIKNELKKNMRQYTMIGVLLVLAIIFSILTGGTFVSSKNISNLFLQASTVAVAAVGVSLVLVAGHIDLSIGSCIGLTGAVAATLMVNAGWGALTTILVTLLTGVVIGCWQGFWVAFRGVPSFIVTLAGSMIFRGIVLGITQGKTIAPLADGFKAIGQGYLPSLSGGEGFNALTMVLAAIMCLTFILNETNRRRSRRRSGLDVTPAWFATTKTAVVCIAILGIMLILALNKGISYALIIVMVLAILFSFVSTNTAFGRHIYAIGGNIEAAKLSGINIKKKLFALFVLMGAMTAVSGIIFTARQNAGTAAAGDGMELDAISAAIIGGTSTMGGEGSVFGALIGALIMTFIDNGMSLMNLDNTFQYIVKGMVLLLAVWMDVATNKKSAM